MPEPLWPRPLPPGGVIGICSPAGPSSPEAAEKAVAELTRRGYRVKTAPHWLERHADRNYLAGDDDTRAADLNGLLADPRIDLILCARGGYGSGRLLDRLDYDAIRRDPKPIVGYSDITALSLGIFARTGVVGFSGIMATAGDGFGQESLDPFSADSFFEAVGDGPFPRTLASPSPWSVLRGGGRVTGPVIPVCLSLLESLMGTPYVPDLSGAILVIEDVGEKLYAVDRALTKLRLAGVLERLAALLIGSFNGVDDTEEATLLAGVPELALERAPAHVAVASGIPYGHISRRLTIPVGAKGLVDLDAATFTFGA